MISEKLFAMYPDLPKRPNPLKDDGNGPYISFWPLEGSAPTIEDIESFELPIERRKISKDLVEQRLVEDGTLQKAMDILLKDADKWRRWFARGFPWVYVDDPDTINLIRFIGSDPEKILA